jgi:ferredoxin
MSDNYRPPEGAATAAKRALRWIAEGHAGSGFTDVGRKRAGQLAARQSLSLDTVKRMYSYFSRHEVDKKGKDFDNMSKPSPGRVAWDAWGGDAGFSWAKRIVESAGKEKAVSSETRVYLPILKFDKQDDGTLLVHGVATDSTVDSDAQICDQEWLKSAMPSWFRWGNIREQHSNIAAGVAEEYEERDGQHWITARVVDPSSVKKVESRVLKGFSIGIHSPRVIKDSKAAGGRIVDGEIVEVSLVDRPANPACTLSLAKAIDSMSLVAVEELVEKRDVSTEEREQLAERGHAMSDGSYPIANVGDLRNAIQAIGRAKNPAKVKEHIIRRAHALGASELIPEGWEGKKAMSAEESSMPPKKEESSAAPKAVEESSVPPKKKPAPGEESTAVKSDTCKGCGEPAKACKCDEGGFDRKAAEESSQKPGEESSQKLGEESSRPGGVAGVAGKADSCDHCGDALTKMSDMVAKIYEKMYGAEESASKSQSEDIAKAVKDIEARVSDIENKAASAVAPVRMAVGSPKAAAVNADVAKAKEYRAKAMSTTDPRLAEGYLALAIELEKSL